MGIYILDVEKNLGYLRLGASSAQLKDAMKLIGKLRTRLGQARLSEREFTAAVAEVIAATPVNLGADDGLLISRAIRELTSEWTLSLLGRPN